MFDLALYKPFFQPKVSSIFLIFSAKSYVVVAFFVTYFFFSPVVDDKKIFKVFCIYT